VTCEDLAGEAHEARRLVLECALASGSCHIGSSLSLVDVLTVLYRQVLRRCDAFLLSKGHAAAGFYAVLARAGVIDAEQLVAGYCSDGGVFPGHPERGLPGVEITGGSLGHGLSIAVGRTLAARHDCDGARTFCLLGDGELNEGSVWEALALAGHLGLGNLVAIVDANGLQGLGRASEVLDLEPLDAKLDAFGWEARVCDGHDHAALEAALAPGARPVAVVARTIKGYGVDFMEDELMWHYRSLRPEDRAIVFEALEGSRRAA
jgi:transketolase